MGKKIAARIEKKEIERVEPPHWWVGLQEGGLQLLVRDAGVAKATPAITETGILIKKVTPGTSPNYLFLDLEIAENSRPTSFNIYFTFPNGSVKIYDYELKARSKAATEYRGFNSSDVIYLIVPDRFANGDPNNDRIPGLKETGVDRSQADTRHGGDILGIIKHLDYINEMGFTAIWPTPLLLNDMAQTSYHGYAITDHYKVDPRFGTLADYQKLVEEAAKRHIKVIMDQVANHCGSGHWWMQDLPFSDWLNYQKNFEEKRNVPKTNHRRSTQQDPYASKRDKQEMTEGWFVDAMPDLNHRNPFLSKYMIQNSIWWIETLGLSGIRQDTYPYMDKDFTAQWAGTIMAEYPNFNIVGEEWSYNPLLIGYWQQGSLNRDGYRSSLPSTMDFSMQDLILEALNEQEAWDTGLIKMYEGLANDFIYASPAQLVAFLDNHDMDRAFTQLNGNYTHFKMALAYLLVLPRIPQIFYGTEVAMENSSKRGDHGKIRSDFPGGWEGDAINAFTGAKLTKDQKSLQTFLKKILNYRKTSKAIHDGKTIHFAPSEGVYVLFRVYGDETVVVIINKNEIPHLLDLSPFAEMGLYGKSLWDIVSGDTCIWGEKMRLGQKGVALWTTLPQ